MSRDRVFPIGCLVSLTNGRGVTCLGHVEVHRRSPTGQLQAAGRALGSLDAKGLDSSTIRAFESAGVAQAAPELIMSLNTGANGARTPDS